MYDDNAYVNTDYMATPFKLVQTGPKDDYNFYHSQVRIKIDCAFGMFTQRWGILRKPLSQSIHVKKIPALVLCLAKLNNFCISMRLKDTDGGTPPPLTVLDTAKIVSSGDVPLVPICGDPQGSAAPQQLLHGGHHHTNHSLG